MTYARFVALLYLLAGVSAVFIWLSWRKRKDPGGTPMVVFHAALVVGAASYAMDITSTTLSTQVFWRAIATVSQGVLAISWLYAALQYANFDRSWTRRIVGLLYLDPVVLGLGFFIPSVTLAQWPTDGSTGSIIGASGTLLTPLFTAHTVVILLVALAGTLVLVRLFLRSRHLYRTQAAAVVVAALAPWTIALSQQFFLSIREDATIFAWGISGAALTAGLYTFKKLDPVPAAQSTIVDTMGDGTVVLDEDGHISDLNPVARRLLGDDETLLGRHISAVVDEWEQLDATVGESSNWQELTLTVDGEQRFLDVELTPFTDRFDTVVGTLVLFRDVTERTQREQRLSQYKTIFDSVTEPVYVIDDDGMFVRYNEPFGELVGYGEDELVGASIDHVLSADPIAADGGDVTDLTETTVTTATGTEVPCESDLAPVELADGSEGRVGIIRDISRRKAIESELAATTERFETLVEASPLAIIAHDTDGAVDVWNPAAEALFGWAAQEVRGDRLPIIPDDHKSKLSEQHERIQSGGHLTGYETPLQRKDGTTVSASVSAAPISEPDGSIVGTVAIIEDISERKARQRRLREQNERLDEFASIVSHDLRNPLQVATGHLELAKQTDGPDEHVQSAEDALDRMEALIEDTLQLAREGRDIGCTEQTRLDDIADRAWETVQTTGGTLQLQALPPVDCDPDRTLELFENLFRNAMTHGREEPETPITVTVGTLTDGFYVEDDGIGIPEDVAADVFDSGYSTADEGTGFGLAIVETIADAHGWDVSVGDSESGGARFEFTGVDIVHG